jgi:hypothetical protein
MNDYIRSKTFLLFKGPGSFTYFFNRRKYRGLKGLSIVTTHSPPPVPLDSTFKVDSGIGLPMVNVLELEQRISRYSHYKMHPFAF